MSVEVFAIFLACFAVLTLMLVFIWSKKGSITALVANRQKLRMLKRYNSRVRNILKERNPDLFVAALLPIREPDGVGIKLHVSWTNFIPAILPMHQVEGVILTEVERSSGMVKFAGVVNLKAFLSTLPKSSVEHLSEFEEFELVKISNIPEHTKNKLREIAKNSELPPGLRGLAVLQH